MSRVLVTGATGFVGRVLCRELAQAGYQVRAAVRDAALRGEDVEPVGDIASADWTAALADVQFVVHAAALAHAPGTPETAYLTVNAQASRRLAEAAAHAGVKRLVYLSSVKVNGEGAARAYTMDDAPAPRDAYARSKLGGENYVRAAGAARGMEVVVVRAPLVYGAGVRANFLRLLSWVDAGWLLPLGAVDNRRSLINVWNLCDFLRATLVAPAAPGRVWLISDGEDLATPALIRRMAAALARRARLLAVPVPLLRALAAIAGRGEELQRLCDSLTVDATAARRELAWSPPLSLDEGLVRTVHWYRHERLVVRT